MPLPLLLGSLASAGLDLLASVVRDKGKELVEAKLGVQLPDNRELTLSEVQAVRSAAIQHEEWLLEHAQKGREAELAADKSEQEEVTKRWQADASSDVPEAKTIRPRTLMFLLALMLVFMLLDIWGKHLGQSWIDLLQILLLTVFAAYFGGRTLEKIVALVTSWKLGGKK